MGRAHAGPISSPKIVGAPRHCRGMSGAYHELPTPKAAAAHQAAVDLQALIEAGKGDVQPWRRVGQSPLNAPAILALSRQPLFGWPLCMGGAGGVSPNAASSAIMIGAVSSLASLDRHSPDSVAHRAPGPRRRNSGTPGTGVSPGRAVAPTAPRWPPAPMSPGPALPAPSWPAFFLPSAPHHPTLPGSPPHRQQIWQPLPDWTAATLGTMTGTSIYVGVGSIRRQEGRRGTSGCVPLK